MRFPFDELNAGFPTLRPWSYMARVIFLNAAPRKGGPPSTKLFIDVLAALFANADLLAGLVHAVGHAGGLLALRGRRP